LDSIFERQIVETAMSGGVVFFTVDRLQSHELQQEIPSL
jgi:hypothetical protein